MPAELVPAWEAFQEQAERVENARKTLLDAMPVGRSFPVPVSVGLDTLGHELDAVEAELDRWRCPQVEQQWSDCAESINVVREQMPRARALSGERIDHPELVIAVRNCVTPLDVWVDAERHWLKLRKRQR